MGMSFENVKKVDNPNNPESSTNLQEQLIVAQTALATLTETVAVLSATISATTASSTSKTPTNS